MLNNSIEQGDMGRIVVNFGASVFLRQKRNPRVRGLDSGSSLHSARNDEPCFRHSREGGNPGFGVWIPGPRSSARNDESRPRHSREGGNPEFGVWIPGLRSTQPGMTSLASVIPAKAGIQGADRGFRVLAPLGPE